MYYNRDGTHNFYNFLIRYYDEKSKVYVNAKTAYEGNLYAVLVAKILKIVESDISEDIRVGLINFELFHVDYLEKLFWYSKNCRKRNSCANSFNNIGKIYYQYFDSLEDMRVDFRRKLKHMKTYIQSEKNEIKTIEDLY